MELSGIQKDAYGLVKTKVDGYLCQQVRYWQNLKKEESNSMGTSIEFQKLLTEIIYVNLPGPEEPTPGMSGGELLHGFLADLYRPANPEIRSCVSALCNKWNIRYRENRG
jgi:hypothetical protein